MYVRKSVPLLPICSFLCWLRFLFYSKGYNPLLHYYKTTILAKFGSWVPLQTGCFILLTCPHPRIGINNFWLIISASKFGVENGIRKPVKVIYFINEFFHLFFFPKILPRMKEKLGFLGFSTFHRKEIQFWAVPFP